MQIITPKKRYQERGTLRSSLSLCVIYSLDADEVDGPAEKFVKWNFNIHLLSKYKTILLVIGVSEQYSLS